MLQPLTTFDSIGRRVIATTETFAIVQEVETMRRIELKRLDAHDVLIAGGAIKEEIVSIDGLAYLKTGKPVKRN